MCEGKSCEVFKRDQDYFILMIEDLRKAQNWISMF